MNFFELIQKRKSIRSFSAQSVPVAVIEKIIEAATYAPSNCNQQLWNFVVVNDPAIKERLIVEAASNTLFRKAPILIAVTYDGWNDKEAIQGASLAVGHMVLAATELGVGAMPMNSYGADTQVKRILQIPAQERICCFVVLGYPDDRAERTTCVPRRPYTETIHWNSFSRTRSPAPFTYFPNDWTIDQIADHQRYYSRKTFMGKEMDIYSSYESDLVEQALSHTPGPLVDFLTYDGAYLRKLPRITTTCVDLIPETSAYSQEAARLTLPQTEHLSFTTWDKLNVSRARSASIIYKLERIPDSFKKELFKKGFSILEDGGVLTIIARKQNIFLWAFYKVILCIFGREVRKTGIYNFFGPYQPISLTKTIAQLKDAGFTQIDYAGYFLVPPFYEQVYQMFLQFRKSEGSSYLHREKRTDVIVRIISWILQIQGNRKCGRFGSVVVIQCKK